MSGKSRPIQYILTSATSVCSFHFKATGGKVTASDPPGLRPEGPQQDPVGGQQQGRGQAGHTGRPEGGGAACGRSQCSSSGIDDEFTSVLQPIQVVGGPGAEKCRLVP
jgi:hypothetical protein